MSEIVHDQARALAALVATLRPDWDVAGVRKALYDARKKGTAEQLCIAAIKAAVEPTNRTPAVIGHDGAHWTAARPLHAAPANYARCPKPGHTSSPAWHCGACRADELAADDHTPTPAPAPIPAAYISGANLARAAAGLPIKETRP
ncbi:hypothetical protein [Oerskovia paurometabola]|uniref:hypothetical protein n=1 Tax=Oerskovia paurometabola TaxID=162170 RepID=UPI00380C8A2E